MISAYLDELKTIDEVVHAANELLLKRIPIRNIYSKNIYDASAEELEEIQRVLKNKKIRVSLVDIDKEYDLYNTVDVKKIGEISKILGSRNVLIKMPRLTNFEAEKDQLITVVKDLLQQFRKEKLEVSFHVNYAINSGYLAYLIKEVKDLRFSYSPAECYINDKSITTYYRLLKERISNVVLYDVDKDKKPALIGYGKALILDIIDKLNIDKYKGDIYYDSNLGSYAKAKKESQEEGFFKKLFSRKKRKSHQSIDEKLRLEEDEEVDFINLLSKQLKIIHKYQKI